MNILSSLYVKLDYKVFINSKLFNLIEIFLQNFIKNAAIFFLY